MDFLSIVDSAKYEYRFFDDMFHRCSCGKEMTGG